MPRRPIEYRLIEAAADPIERRLARAVERAAQRVREHLVINDIAMALASRDARRAAALLTRRFAEESLGPAATIVRNATIKGGRVGADIVNGNA